MPRSKRGPWIATANKENAKLACKQSGWNLAGATGQVLEGRTRHRGHGRPNLDKRMVLEVSSDGSEKDEDEDEVIENEDLYDSSDDEEEEESVDKDDPSDSEGEEEGDQSTD